MNKLENSIRVTLQRTLLKIRLLVMKHGERFNLKSNELRDLHNTLKNAQIIAFLMGQRRARLSVPGLKADVLDSILKGFKNVDKRKLDRLNAYYDMETLKIVSEMTVKLNKSIRTALQETASAQLQTKSATAILSTALDKAGISPTNSYYTENLVRTHTQLAYNAARWQEYQSEDIQDILWGYTYVTVGDDRVREEHEKLDGVTLPKDDPFWSRFFPPNGWSCRCQAIPIFEKERIKRPPEDVKPDEGFDFNPGQVVERLGI